MSHNSYQQKLAEINYQRERSEIQLKGERHFTKYDIDALRGKLFYYFLVGSVCGAVFATLLIHYWK